MESPPSRLQAARDFVVEQLRRLLAAIKRHPVRAALALPALMLLYVLILIPFTPSIGDLRKADLDEGVFEGSYFSYINFAQSYMANADLRNVTMTEADLSGADLRGAKLCGADLSTATLAEALLDGAVADDSTRWPQPETDYSNYGVVPATDPEECE